MRHRLRPLLYHALLACTLLPAAPGAMAALSPGAIQLLVQEADVLQQQYRYDEALKLLQRAQQASVGAEGADAARNVLNSLANLYYSTGQLEAAARHYRELIELDRQAGDLQGLSVSYFNLAHALGTQGDLAGSQQALEQALALSQQLGDASGEAFTLKALGVNAQARGDSSLAESRLQQALQGFEQLGDKNQSAAVWRNLGDLRLAAGDAAAAEPLYQTAIATLHDSPFHDALLHSYRGLAVAQEQLGRFEAALAAQRAYTGLLQYELEQRNEQNTQRLQAEFQTRHLATENERLALLQAQQALQLDANRHQLQLQSLALVLGVIVVALVLWMLRHSRQHARSLQHMATTDELTGLLNRRAILTQARAEWQRSARFGQSLACLMFDADHFKSINDDYGHAQGDAVLRHIADQLHKVLRSTDMVGRVGGEEFLVVAPQTDRLQAMSLAERIRAAIEAIQVPGMEERRLSVSIGIAGLLDESSVDELIRHADQALYIAKRSGRNRCILYHGRKPSLPQLQTNPLPRSKRNGAEAPVRDAGY